MVIHYNAFNTVTHSDGIANLSGVYLLFGQVAEYTRMPSGSVKKVISLQCNSFENYICLGISE